MKFIIIGFNLKFTLFSIFQLVECKDELEVVLNLSFKNVFLFVEISKLVVSGIKSELIML